jgi:hypothetical protein
VDADHNAWATFRHEAAGPMESFSEADGPPPQPGARSNMAMCRAGGKVWMLGGGHRVFNPKPTPQITCFNDVWWWSGGCWDCVTGGAPWNPRYGHMACGYETDQGMRDCQLIMMGGTVSNGARYNDVWTTSDGGNWYGLGNAPWTGRSDALVAVVNKWIYLFGGIDTNNFVQQDLWAVQMLGGNSLGPWQLLSSTIPTGPICREGGYAGKPAACCALNGSIYVVTSDSNDKPVVWRVTPNP